MNIVYVIDQWPKLSQSFVIREVSSLVQRGHNVAVWALNHNPNPEIAAQDVSELEIPVGSPSNSSPLSPSVLYEFLSNPQIVNRLIRHTEFLHTPIRAGMSLPWTGDLVSFINNLDWEIDLIHTHFLTDWAFTAVFAADIVGTKASGTAHAFDIFKENHVQQLPVLAKNLDQIVTISEFHREYISERINSDTPINVIHCGVDPTQFNPSECRHQKRIVTVARDVPKKGLEFGIAALSEVASKHPEAEWRIIGPSNSRLEQIAIEHDVEDQVSVLGRVSEERLIEELDKASLTLLPCVIEPDGNRDGIPVALMEAMAMRTVPITSPVAGIPELVQDGKNGYLSSVLSTDDGLRLPEKGSPSICKELVKTLDDALYSDQTTRGHRARETIESSFNINEESNKVEMSFSKLINENL